MAPSADSAAMTVAEPTAEALSVADVRRVWAKRFRAAGIDSPELDARILVARALGLDHAALVAADARRLTLGEEQAVAVLAQRRLAREPVARILGFKEFWGLPLRVDASTLVPRPETETVVEAALAFLDARRCRTAPLRIADLGTGSGAVLLALLSELTNALGVGTDASAAALLVARDNASRLGLGRAHFVCCDMAEALHGPFDLILSNPPYVVSGDMASLAPEVRNFDPRRALDGGPDGLGFYRSIAAAAPALLAPDGAVIVELGSGQAQPVRELFAGAGLAPMPPRPDIGGTLRALLARKGMMPKHWPPAKKHARQKSTWNIAWNRLVCGYGIAPR